MAKFGDRGEIWRVVKYGDCGEIWRLAQLDYDLGSSLSSSLGGSGGLAARRLERLDGSAARRLGRLRGVVGKRA